VLAYLLGPIAFTEPPWVAIGVTVVAVLLLTARERLHGFARRLEIGEIVTAGKFLILTGLVLPFLPSQPVTAVTTITPHQVWLAVVAVCTVSYVSYLLQRYVTPREGGLWTAVLGGLYSSTATTVVLARRAGGGAAQAQAGIILATAIMYLRLLIIVTLFDYSLAWAIAPAMLTLSAFGLALAALWWFASRPMDQVRPAESVPGNPLELTPALVFAVLFIAISLATAWVRLRFGSIGIYVLASVVGLTDIDPFVLSIASGSAAPLAGNTAAAAVLIAASSNNLLKAVYAIGFGGFRFAMPPAAGLGLLALAGATLAWWTF